MRFQFFTTVLCWAATLGAPLAAHVPATDSSAPPTISTAEIEELLVNPLLLERVATAQVSALEALIIEREEVSGDLYQETGLTSEARRWLTTTCPLAPDAVEAVSPLIVLEALHERSEDKAVFRELAIETIAGMIARALAETSGFAEVLDQDFVRQVTEHPETLAAAVVADRWFETETPTSDHRAVFCRDVDRPLCAVATHRLRSPEAEAWLASLSYPDLVRVADPFGVHDERIRTAARKTIRREGAPDGGDLEFASGLVDFVRQMKQIAAREPGKDFREMEGAVEISAPASWRPFVRSAAWRALERDAKVDLQEAFETARQYYERILEVPPEP